MTPPLVLVAEPIDPEARAWLEQRCRTAGLADADAGEAEGLVVRTYTRVDEALLERLPRLRVVGRAGVGVDNIDLAACRDRDVAVVHTPEANADAVAEFVFALLFDRLRRRPAIHAPVPAAKWNRLRDEAMDSRELRGMTLGILGMGRIGRRVARIGAGFGMPVIYNDLIEVEEAQRAGAAPATSDELLSQADVLTIHVDGRPQNRRLVNEAALARMKADIVLVNTSRGFVVERVALAAFLRANPGALALLDVHDPEPIEPGDPLLDLPNAVLTPHIAACTRPAKRAMSGVVEDVWRVLSGEAPRFEVKLE